MQEEIVSKPDSRDIKVLCLPPGLEDLLREHNLKRIDDLLTQITIENRRTPGVGTQDRIILSSGEYIPGVAGGAVKTLKEAMARQEYAVENNRFVHSQLLGVSTEGIAESDVSAVRQGPQPKVATIGDLFRILNYSTVNNIRVSLKRFSVIPSLAKPVDGLNIQDGNLYYENGYLQYYREKDIENLKLAMGEFGYEMNPSGRFVSVKQDSSREPEDLPVSNAVDQRGQPSHLEMLQQKKLHREKIRSGFWPNGRPNYGRDTGNPRGF